MFGCLGIILKTLTKHVIQVNLVIEYLKILRWRGNPHRLHPNPSPVRKKSFCSHIMKVHLPGVKAKVQADGVENKEVGVGKAQLVIVGQVIVGKAAMVMIGGKETMAHNHTGRTRMHSQNGQLKGRTTANNNQTNDEGVVLILGADVIVNDEIRESGEGRKKILKIPHLAGQKNILGFR